MSPVLKKGSILFLAGALSLTSIIVTSGQALSQYGRERNLELSNSEISAVGGSEGGRDVITIKSKNGTTIQIAVGPNGETIVTTESPSGNRTTTNTDENGNQNTTSN